MPLGAVAVNSSWYLSISQTQGCRRPPPPQHAWQEQRQGDPQVLCARDSPLNSGQHDFLSSGETLMQDKLADSDVHRVTFCV